MKTVIAICDNAKCGALFTAPNLMNISGNARIQFKGAKLGPCPNCGSYGSVPDGIYGLIDEAIELTEGPKESFEILQQIQKLLLDFKDNPVDRDKVVEKIKVVSPSFAEKLSEFKNASYHTWIQTILTIIGFLITAYQMGKSDKDDIKDQVILELVKQKNTPTVINNYYNGPKIQRNDKCPCNSGKKYKKCCLQEK